MDYYIFTRWTETDEGYGEAWAFQIAMPNRDEAEAYVKRHTEGNEIEFRIVTATTLPEARADLRSFMKSP